MEGNIKRGIFNRYEKMIAKVASTQEYARKDAKPQRKCLCGFAFLRELKYYLNILLS